MPKIAEVPQGEVAVAEGGARIQIANLMLVDAAGVLSAQEQRALVGDATGRQLDYAGLLVYRDRVTAYLRSKGYLMARAFLPQQDVTDGVVHIQVVPGVLDSNTPFFFDADGTTEPRLDIDFLSRVAQTELVAGEALQQDKLSTSLLKLSDLQGIQVKAAIEQGEQPGELRVKYLVETEPLFSGMALVNNHGARNTGNAQAMAILRVVNPSGLGDQGSLFALKTEGINFAQLSYDRPVHPAGWVASGGITALDYKVVTEAGLLQGLTGSVLGANLGLTYPLLRSAQRNVFFSSSLAKQQLRDDSINGRIKARDKHIASLGLQGAWSDMYAGVAYNSWSLNWTTGHLDLSGVADDALKDKQSFNTAGAFNKVSYSFSRLQRLTDTWSGYAAFSGQYAFNNLDSSEQMSVSGANSIKAYPASEPGGDIANVLTAELRYQLPAVRGFDEAQLVGAYDIGRVRLRKDLKGQTPSNALERNTYTLEGVGLGLKLVRHNDLMFHLQFSTKLGANKGRDVNGLDADGRDSDKRVWVQLIKWF